MFIIAFHTAVLFLLVISLYVTTVSFRVMKSGNHAFDAAMNLHERVLRMLERDQAVTKPIHDSARSKPKDFLD
jgi:hypothetical protein